MQSIAAKQQALGANFKLIVLSSSSTALVNLGLANINDYAYGVGVSITGAVSGDGAAAGEGAWRSRVMDTRRLAAASGSAGRSGRHWRINPCWMSGS